MNIGLVLQFFDFDTLPETQDFMSISPRLVQTLLLYQPQFPIPTGIIESETSVHNLWWHVAFCRWNSVLEAFISLSVFTFFFIWNVLF